ncbi:2-dehydro-3-deoxyglucarate aldolase/4-hydroxy-2-oxoheptanedioate aldolase/2-dehydro-3-deoxy-L-rhamnonate aldolase [Psychrobacillus insolitus]|uniref:2-dehydro-3-deoxyglucarate aldolase/4-hydroxy-2-oxoheptanedioate aldolase/2-dehydro-3-deoxy-L-rhamnonate aldolase n=1 Tax=Psychrobacillus insolitus TaxID=1461 RepID=A0A2W7ML36_9BACI|nr:aldolase/citrate lyase family protein [Psychrobacillus insolitus]PZX04607.1 2-dehydro-3-deoxyglucarate aldolase/4-hydroxy-2-oxoheptanedioate aldolase/2-dehydro-3-deoxy-L-rhamnonate aldolase [Psychrobacillus insolitus]
MKMRNLVKEKLAKNGHVLGAFVASGSPTNVEILGLNNFDFVLIDMEHAQTDMETMVNMIRAAELYDMAPIARVYHPNDGPMMSRMLDVGIHGLMIPMVETKEQAQYIIEHMKLAPLGKRGMGAGRGPRWGWYENYNKGEVNDNTYVIMQCETRKGVENIEEICQTPGLDCIFIGTADLSQDMGSFGDNNNKELQAAINKVLDACKKHNIVPGIVTGTAEEAAKRIQQGFQFVSIMNDLGFFRSQTKNQIDAVRNSLSE